MNLKLWGRIFLLVLLNIPVYAAVIDRDDYFNAVCNVDDSVGFNWGKSRWNITKFQKTRYIVQKLKIEKIEYGKNAKLPKSGFCSEQINTQAQIGSDNEKANYACYNIREEGSDFYSSSSEECVETWKKSGENYQLISVDCKMFKFNPNGWFHNANIHGQVENNPKDNYKDSLSISYGKCSTL